MTTIAILPETNNSYRAVAGNKESMGRTAGEALDALAPQLLDEEGGTLVIVQNLKADQFFNAAQQERLTELMQLRKASKLSLEEESELESLVEAELDGAQRRVKQKIRPGKEALSGGWLIRYKAAYFLLSLFIINTICVMVVVFLVGFGIMALPNNVIITLILLAFAEVSVIFRTVTRILFSTK
jgi:hypothetical protein